MVREVLFVCASIILGVTHGEVCGTQPGVSKGRKPRILHGEDAQRGAWPWQGLLFQSGTPFCGAVLIEERWVLTSALCVSNIKPDIVRLGEHDVSLEGEDDVQEMKVEKVLTHPDYQGRITENDIALIKLDKSVIFSNFVRPICLPREDIDLTGSTAWSTGWGNSNLAGQRNKNILQEIVQEVLGNEECEEIYEDLGHSLSLPEGGYICTLDREGDKSNCYGDGGGPVVVQRDDKSWELVGIQSWGVGCGRSGQPNVAAKVEAFLTWIEDTLSS